MRIKSGDRLMGLVYGGMIGDALGLPYEGLSKQRRSRIFKKPQRFNFFFGKGIVSDDSDHLLLCLSALIATENQDDFIQKLAGSLKRWFLCLPPGIGMGTLVSLAKLWVGVSPARSGGSSAGNGPCMRSMVIGALDAPIEDIEALVIASSEMTHRDQRALTAALAVARLARICLDLKAPDSSFGDTVLLELRAANVYQDAEWSALVDAIAEAYKKRLELSQFQELLGIEAFVSGFSYHSVPVAIYAFLRYHGDFERTMMEAVLCGGDSDTVGFIAAGLAGALVGFDGIPSKFHHGPMSWPCDFKIAGQLQAQVKAGEALRNFNFPWASFLARNLFSWLIIMVHILRRIANRLGI